MAPSFLNLAVETRRMIYELLLVRPTILLEAQRTHYIRWQQYAEHIYYGLSSQILRVCHQITAEALPIFYTKNTFKFEAVTLLSTEILLPTLLSSNQPFHKNFHHLRNIVFDTKGMSECRAFGHLTALLRGRQHPLQSVTFVEVVPKTREWIMGLSRELKGQVFKVRMRGDTSEVRALVFGGKVWEGVEEVEEEREG